MGGGWFLVEWRRGVIVVALHQQPQVRGYSPQLRHQAIKPRGGGCRCALPKTILRYTYVGDPTRAVGDSGVGETAG